MSYWSRQGSALQPAICAAPASLPCRHGPARWTVVLKLGQQPIQPVEQVVLARRDTGVGNLILSPCACCAHMIGKAQVGQRHSDLAHFGGSSGAMGHHAFQVVAAPLAPGDIGVRGLE